MEASTAPEIAEVAKAVADGVSDDLPAVSDSTGTQAIGRFTRWLHLGIGATSCPGITQDENGKVTKVECTDFEHTHVWIRLPNPFQHNLCREEALAARARRIRVLRMEDSNSRVIMEEELDRIVRGGDESRIVLIEELATKEWFRDQLDALRDVQEREEFEHIERDRARRNELEEALKTGPSDAEPSEELLELRKHFGDYATAIEEKLNLVTEPKRAALRDKTTDELIDMVREQRITEDAEAEFEHTFAYWEWFYGTYTPAMTSDGRHPTRRYATIAELKEEDDVIVEALRENFKALNTLKNKVSQGNS